MVNLGTHLQVIKCNDGPTQYCRNKFQTLWKVNTQAGDLYLGPCQLPMMELSDEND